MKPGLVSPALAGELLATSTTWEAWRYVYIYIYIFTRIYIIYMLAIIIWISTEVSCTSCETSEVK